MKLIVLPDRLRSCRPALKRYGSAILAAWMLAVFLLVNFALPRFSGANLNLYVLQPLLWLSLAGLVLVLQAAAGQALRPFEGRDVFLSGALLGAGQVAAAVGLGLLLGFGLSPYAREPLYVVLNLWFVFSRLVGVEVARWYLVKPAAKKHLSLGYFLAWLLPLLLMIPFGKFGLLGRPESAFRITGQTLLPAAAESLLAATLAYLGGPVASIAYRGVLQAFEWLSPILPDLPWMAAAFVGVLVPVLGLLFLHRPEPEPQAGPEAQPAPSGKQKKHENASPASWLMVAGLAVVVIWFNTGFLGVRPSLVSGNSMNPVLYPGDVVITHRVAPEQIQLGDVIRFRKDNIDVVHRVIDIRQESAGIVFTTRGDNNNTGDDPIPAELYEGKVILTLPKIGWISIFLRQALGWIGGLL
jgi:signal peptidase